MGKAIYNEQEIIAAGLALEKAEGRSVSGWEIHKSMGGVGKLSRTQNFWDSFVAERPSQAQEELSLPDELEERFDGIVEKLREEFTSIMCSAIRDIQEGHLRQSEIARRDHQAQRGQLESRIKSKNEEIEFLRNRVEELEAEEEELNDTADPVPSPIPLAVAQP